MVCSVYALIMAYSLTSDCPQASAWEVSYQALHAYDYAQTVQIARSPCYEEVDPITSNIIGHHPTQTKVELWWAAESMLHYAISGWLDRTAEAEGGGWHVVRAVWNVGSVAWEARDVVHNARMGLRPFGGNKCPPPLTIQEHRR
jgi:hypothetical protein